MSSSQYLGQHARLRLLELGGRSPSYQNVWDDETENMRKRLLSGPTVDIRVGPEQKHWSLHRNLLCHHSSYFETELRVDEKAATNGTKHHQLDLPDDDPAGFELLVKWLYQGQLEDASQMSDEAKYDYAVACHKLYLLCDRFDMTRLKNISMDQYRQCLNESQLVPDAEEINEIYRASPMGSHFRSLMVRIAARQIMDPEVDRNAESYRKCFENNPDFAVEMVNAIRSMSGGILFDDPTHGSQCNYHDHDDVSGCQHEGKGKARATKAGAVNGQGLPATLNSQSSGNDKSREPSAESPAAKRTPRKLGTPRRSAAIAERAMSGDGAVAKPDAAQPAPKARIDSEPIHQTISSGGRSATRANIRSPRVPSTVPPKLERRDSVQPTSDRSQPRTTSTGNVQPLSGISASTESPFDAADLDGGAQQTTAMRVPHMSKAAVQRNVGRPLDPRTAGKGLAINVNGIVPNPAFVSPSLDKEHRPLSRANLAKANRLITAKESHEDVPATTRQTAPANHADTNGIRRTNGTSNDNESTLSAKSRKRKMQDRTPKKARNYPRSALDPTAGPDQASNDAARPPLDRSSTSRSSAISRATSITSGPRKLSRVSSVVKFRSGNGGTTSIDGKSAGAMHSRNRRPPPKLRINSPQT